MSDTVSFSFRWASTDSFREGSITVEIIDTGGSYTDLEDDAYEAAYDRVRRVCSEDFDLLSTSQTNNLF